MSAYMLKILMTGSLFLGGMTAAAFSQAKGGGGSAALDTFGGNGSPIRITSDQLDVFDKEGKAVFVGNVIAVQEKSTLKCKKLEVFYTQDNVGQKPEAEKEKEKQAAAPKVVGLGMPSDSSSIRQIECLGPVTIVSETQVATGDHATFDRKTNKVHLKGNVVLKDGANVSEGDRLIYDVNTGIAKIEGRVRTLFIPENSSTSGR